MADVNTEDDTENIHLSGKVIFAELRAAAEWLRKIWQIEAAKGITMVERTRIHLL